MWRADFDIQLFADETATIPFLPRNVTLSDLTLDGRQTPILIEGKHFATLVRGRGLHRLRATFQVPVVKQGGPSRIDLVIPKVPVSRFDLKLPGRKEVAVTPSVAVTHRVRGGVTQATLHVPMTGQVALTRSEAIPETVRREVRANATIYHVVHAEERVLFVRAFIHYDVRRGETNRILLAVPASVQVNEVGSPSGAVNDWRIEGSGNSRVLMIFLDRQLSGEMVFQVDYDRSLSSEPNELIPLLSARDVHRQRGMVAYLSGRDLTLNPTAEDAATRVGENQLPAYVKDAIDKTIAHTFKYADQTPELRAEVAAPERVAGKFDAQVDTLLSLGEVTLTGTVSVEVNVKSGVVDRLELTLPADAELLGLTAPSLRTHRVNEDDPQLPLVEVEFTQDMEGQFRIELSYERILQGDERQGRETASR